MSSQRFLRWSIWIIVPGLVVLGGWSFFATGGAETTARPRVLRSTPAADVPIEYRPRHPMDVSGFHAVVRAIEPWDSSASLADLRTRFDEIGFRLVEQIDRQLAAPGLPAPVRIDSLMMKAIFLNYEGESRKAYDALAEARRQCEADPKLAAAALYTVVFLQGATALRIGENDNCILCRGESSCILPISSAAQHTQPEGSRLAIQHFSEYLARFPDDLDVRWLLNVAFMTLGEHPGKVPTEHRLSIDAFARSEFDIGRFRDIGHLVGLNRLNQAGGAVMEDFDGDGLLDVAVTSFDPCQQMDLYRNAGDGTFEPCTESAGLTGQLGGMNCVQTDYNNDGNMDLFVIRGAWLADPVRPSLLRNNGDWTFTDVTGEAGLAEPVNSIAAAWSDYDNDGWLDLFVCCERQPNRLYRNRRDGSFEEVAEDAGVQLADRSDCKGAAWLDYDNDGFQDLYLSYLAPQHGGQLFRNQRDGTFRNVTAKLGIDGPQLGFSCWAFDFNNDGWLDIFASSYDQTLSDVVKGLLGESHGRQTNRLYLNRAGKRFEDVSKTAGLDRVFAAMGSNFGDFDNDGFLDFYLGTGDPSYSTLVPNRMFKNVAGERFAEITGSSGTGQLQKGHGIACGDWDRDGNVDIFAQMGGVADGDKYHNILFQNPGHDAAWITVRLVGKKSNRAAIGARLKVVTSGGEQPRTIHRLISSGSSFGANPLQQTIGLADAEQIAELVVEWPTSGTKQIFRDLKINQAVEVTEFADDYKRLDWKPIPLAISSVAGE